MQYKCAERKANDKRGSFKQQSLRNRKSNQMKKSLSRNHECAKRMSLNALRISWEINLQSKLTLSLTAHLHQHWTPQLASVSESAHKTIKQQHWKLNLSIFEYHLCFSFALPNLLPHSTYVTYTCSISNELLTRTQRRNNKVRKVSNKKIY